MRVGVDRTKYSVQIPLPPKIDPTVSSARSLHVETPFTIDLRELYEHAGKNCDTIYVLSEPCIVSYGIMLGLHWALCAMPHL